MMSGPPFFANSSNVAGVSDVWPGARTSGWRHPHPSHWAMTRPPNFGMLVSGCGRFRTLARGMIIAHATTSRWGAL